jgi:hypothetical protein
VVSLAFAKDRNKQNAIPKGNGAKQSCSKNGKMLQNLSYLKTLTQNVVLQTRPVEGTVGFGKSMSPSHAEEARLSRTYPEREGLQVRSRAGGSVTGEEPVCPVCGVGSCLTEGSSCYAGQQAGGCSAVAPGRLTGNLSLQEKAGLGWKPETPQVLMETAETEKKESTSKNTM